MEFVPELLADLQLLSLHPVFGTAPEERLEFRWGMNVTLPFPLPARQCVVQNALIDNVLYDVHIGNHFRRAIVTRHVGPPNPARVFLEDTRKPPNEFSDDATVTRHELPSVAVFSEGSLYKSADDAFAESKRKMESCMEWLSSLLARWQRNAPYGVAWLIYPVSPFDFGTIYHQVIARESAGDQWQVYASAAGIFPGRNLIEPAFYLDPPDSSEAESAMDTANELLAEAQLSLFRGLYRLTVLNAYTAVESLAESIFLSKRALHLVKTSTQSLPDAQKTAEDERKQNNRNTVPFLFHTGMNSACGRSLFSERKSLYDRLCAVRDIRHKAAHTGYRPERNDAKNAHRVCADVAGWLADVGAYTVKDYYPQKSCAPDNLAFGSIDQAGRPAWEAAFLRDLATGESIGR